MTKAQCYRLIVKLWPEVCRVQGWQPSEEWRRHKIYEEVLGTPKRFSAFTEEDFTRVKARFLRLADKLEGALEDGHPEINVRRQRLWKIRNQQMKLLGLYDPDPLGYMATITRRRWSVPVEGLLSLEDLDNEQLTQLRDTLAARIDDMRKEAGDTVAEMLRKGGFGKAKARPAATAAVPKEGQPF